MITITQTVHVDIEAATKNGFKPIAKNVKLTFSEHCGFPLPSEIKLYRALRGQHPELVKTSPSRVIINKYGTAHIIRGGTHFCFTPAKGAN